VKKNVQLAEENLLRLEELNREAYGEPDEGGVEYAGDDSSNRSPAAKTDQMENEIESDDSAWQ